MMIVKLKLMTNQKAGQGYFMHISCNECHDNDDVEDNRRYCIQEWMKALSQITAQARIGNQMRY